jgi:hypothetical protein
MKQVVFLGIFAALSPLASAHAVVLEQKWTPGQDLNYQTVLRGTMNVQAPASANFMLAGVPLDVEIRGDGIAQLKTLSVDGAGVGTVAVRVPQFDLQAETWGQKGQMTLSENSSKFSLNGKAIKLGDGTNPLGNAQNALRISRQGRVIGVQNLAPKTPVAAKTDDEPVDVASAINKGALMTAAILRALPTLWPGRDIAPGESWKAQVNFPVASPTDPKKVTPTQFGEWNLTLKGAETVAGRQLQRVGVVGSLSVDSAQFAVPTAKAPRGVAKQDVSGDLWLDAANGQIARADLVVGARVEGGKGTKDASHADFTGTLQLNLKGAA